MAKPEGVARLPDLRARLTLKPVVKRHPLPFCCVVRKVDGAAVKAEIAADVVVAPRPAAKGTEPAHTRHAVAAPPVLLPATYAACRLVIHAAMVAADQRRLPPQIAEADVHAVVLMAPPADARALTARPRGRRAISVLPVGA